MKALLFLLLRERDVFGLVVQGLLNKQIAAKVGASERTIKIHRGRVMRKMQLQSVAELVLAAVIAGLLKIALPPHFTDHASRITPSA